MRTNPVAARRPRTGWVPSPVENLVAGAAPIDDGSAIVADRQQRRERRERLERARDRLDIKSSPQDSSPAIRHLLGYDQEPRPPRRWEPGAVWTGHGAELGYVDAGPVDPTAASRARPAGPARAGGRSSE